MVQDRTEELPALRRPAPVIDERTEVLPVVSPPAPAVVDRTEIHARVPRLAPAIADRTEIHAHPERTEVVRSNVATVQEEEKTAPRRPLTSSLMALALARAKAGAADPEATRLVTSEDSPTEKNVKPPSPADPTLLLPPEPASPVAVGVVPAAQARPPTLADTNEATTVFRPVQIPAIPKPAGDRFKKVLIWINIVCFSVVLLVMLWLLIT
jgi:hypothetical protein